jgi:hypothetical protein
MPGLPLALPLAERRFRHPTTGVEALLRVDTLPQPGGDPPWFQVRVVQPDGQAGVPGVMYLTEVKHRSWARRVWAERERELRAAGYERVQQRRTRVLPPAASPPRDQGGR